MLVIICLCFLIFDCYYCCCLLGAGVSTVFFSFFFTANLRAGSSPFVDGVKWFQLGLVSFFFSFSFRSPNSVLNRQIQHKFPRKNVEIYFLFSENKKMAETNLI